MRLIETQLEEVSIVGCCGLKSINLIRVRRGFVSVFESAA